MDLMHVTSDLLEIMKPALQPAAVQHYRCLPAHRLSPKAVRGCILFIRSTGADSIGGVAKHWPGCAAASVLVPLHYTYAVAGTAADDD